MAVFIPEGVSHEAIRKMPVNAISLASAFGESGLYGWQSQVMADVWEVGSRVALVTPNGAGKTSCVVATLGLSFMAAFPGCQVVSTAGAWRQVQQQLWPVLTAKLAAFPEWRIIEGEITAPRIDGLPPSRWNAFSASDPEKAEGYHPREWPDKHGRKVFAPLIFIVDEAKAISEGIMQAMYRCVPTHVLVCSTPGEDNGPFYDIVRDTTGLWKIHRVKWHDCPHLMAGLEYRTRKALVAGRGAKDPFVQSMVFGEFFRTGLNYVFDNMELVDLSMSGTIPRVGTEVRCAVDLSLGTDKQVVAIRRGNICTDLFRFNERDTTRLCHKLVSVFREHNLSAESITADNGGPGKPIIDVLESMGFRGIRRYMNNAPAGDKMRYANRYAEDCFEFLKYRLGYIGLPNDPALREQMSKRQFTMPNGNENKMALESKSDVRIRNEPSPDELDAIIMLFAGMPDPQEHAHQWRPPPMFRRAGRSLGEMDQTVGVPKMRMEE